MFGAATAMTPLQYQKQLRLQEARRLMMADRIAAAEAALHNSAANIGVYSALLRNGMLVRYGGRL